MAKVFFSYRRTDSADETKRIYRQFEQSFGVWRFLGAQRRNLFLDKDNITPDGDFRAHIQRFIINSDHMLVIIGDTWLEEIQRRKAKNEVDFVLIEIDLAFIHKVNVIPVLINGASMPSRSELPSEINQLATQHAHEIREVSFESDTEQLIKHTRPARVLHLLSAIIALSLLIGLGVVLRELLPEFRSQPIIRTEILQVASSRLNNNAEWQNITNGKGYMQIFNDVEMMLVPTGCFRIGNDNGRESEANGNRLCFDELFWIDKYEVTRARYEICVDNGACSDVQDRNYYTQPNQAINGVTWFQADTYCEWRNARLPTEAEWEYSARGPDALIYPWGNRYIGDYASRGSLLVGSYPSGISWVGALDMSGGVWEWTNSLYEIYPYDEDDGREAPSGIRIDIRRTLRGGLFFSPPVGATTSQRLAEQPNSDEESYGFRCARDYEE